MEKTRTDKYKKYREGASKGEETEVKDEYDEDRDDDFLSFIPGEKEEAEEEEELHPLSYDTLKNDEVVTNALKSANAKNDYDTKMDILNRLKENKADRVDLNQFNTTNLSEGHEVGAKGESVSLVDKLETMDDTFKSAPKPKVAKEEKKAEPKKPAVKKPEVKKAETKKDLVDEASFKSPVMKEHEPVTLSRKEIKALKKQEKTARKLEKEEEKAAKKALAESKKANELAEKEKKKQEEIEAEKARAKQEALTKAKEAKAEKEVNKAEAYEEPVTHKAKKKKPSLLSRMLDLILIILIIIILVMVVYTAVSIM